MRRDGERKQEKAVFQKKKREKIEGGKEKRRRERLELGEENGKLFLIRAFCKSWMSIR